MPSNDENGVGRRLGDVGQWPLLVLHSDEILVMCSEDQKARFHCYEIHPCWRGYFVYNRTAPDWCSGKSDGIRRRPWNRTSPMGWVQAVDFMQEALETIVLSGPPRGADIPDELLIQLRKAILDQSVPPYRVRGTTPTLTIMMRGRLSSKR